MVSSELVLNAGVAVGRVVVVGSDVGVLAGKVPLCEGGFVQAQIRVEIEMTNRGEA